MVPSSKDLDDSTFTQVFSPCFWLWKYPIQILSFKELFFLLLFVCGSTWNRFWVSRNCFSNSFCLWKYLEQILTFKELFFLIFLVCGSARNRFWVWWNCFFSFFLYVELLRTDIEFGETVFSHSFCLWKYSEQILSFKEQFFLILFVCESTRNRFWVSRNCFFSFFVFVGALETDIEF